MIRNYNDFVCKLSESGFSMGGENSEGIYSIINWNWNESPPYETEVKWHTGDADTDPWEWRVRVLDERDDIAYAKLFFKKSGFITKKWYPYFLAVRRQNKSFEEEYEEGNISQAAKAIYSVILENGTLSLHILKKLSSFSKADNSKFDRALIELQMKMYLTMRGRQQKISKKGEEYGWSSTVFCTTESFFGDEVFKEASQIDVQKGIEEITAQILKLNSNADSKKMLKFIKG